MLFTYEFQLESQIAIAVFIVVLSKLQFQSTNLNLLTGRKPKH